MQGRINELQRVPNYKEALRERCRTNKISITLLNGLTTKKIRVIYQRTLKHYQSNPHKAQANWFQNELRLFHWILIIESLLINLPLRQFSLPQWQKIGDIFTTKTTDMFEFQAKKLMGIDREGYSRNWLSQQCQLLCRILSEQGMLNRWNEVSRRLYELSAKRYYRSSKQCRQQWLNHLDLSKKHGQWNQEQDVIILNFVLENGRKWANMCRELLPHRTEHMIKNRFKSLLFRSKDLKERDIFNERKLIRKVLNKIKKLNQTQNEVEQNWKNGKEGQINENQVHRQSRDSFLSSQSVSNKSSSPSAENSENYQINNHHKKQQNNQSAQVSFSAPIHQPYQTIIELSHIPTYSPTMFSVMASFPNNQHQMFNSFTFTPVFANLYAFNSGGVNFSSATTISIDSYPLDSNIQRE